MRRSIMPALVRALDFNLRRGCRDLRLFETGRVFLAAGSDRPPLEPHHAGLVWTGLGRAAHWSEPERRVDLYDLMGLVEHLLRALAPEHDLARERATRPCLHPGLSVRWRTEPGVGELAWGGRLHPDLEHEIGQAVFVAEIDLDRLAGLPARTRPQQPIPRVPAVWRDLSVVLGPEVPYARVVETLRRVPAPAPAEFAAIDRYVGPPLAAGQASLTVRVGLQPLERTLTEAEIEAYRKDLIAALSSVLELGIRDA
jgi:phenylalanyl-tRNA synthetase beta chain